MVDLKTPKLSFEIYWPLEIENSGFVKTCDKSIPAPLALSSYYPLINLVEIQRTRYQCKSFACTCLILALLDHLLIYWGNRPFPKWKKMIITKKNSHGVHCPFMNYLTSKWLVGSNDPCAETIMPFFNCLAFICFMFIPTLSPACNFEIKAGLFKFHVNIYLLPTLHFWIRVNTYPNKHTYRIFAETIPFLDL